MSRRIDFIIAAEDEPIVESCELTENDLAELVVTLARGSNNTRIVLSFVSNDSKNNTVFSFVNQLVADGLTDLSDIDKVIYIEDDIENIIDGENIKTITNLNTQARFATEFELIKMEDYPSFFEKAQDNNDAGEV